MSLLCDFHRGKPRRHFIQRTSGVFVGCGEPIDGDHATLLMGQKKWFAHTLNQEEESVTSHVVDRRPRVIIAGFGRFWANRWALNVRQ